MRTSRSITPYEPLSEPLLRALAREVGNPYIVSFQLNVDGKRYPAPDSYLVRLESMLDTARRGAREAGAEDRNLDEDLGDVRRLCLAADRSLTRSVAVFAATRSGLLRAVSLPVEVEDKVTLAPWADLEQLTDVLGRTGSWVVALTDGHSARVFHVSQGEVDEVTTVVDPAERQADTDVELGGWDHRRDEAARHHLRRVADAVGTACDDDVTGLALGGPQQVIEPLIDLLAPSESALVAGRLSLSVDAAERDVVEAVQELEVQRQRGRGRTAARRARDAIGSGRGVGGIAAVLQALSERRVERLVVARRYRAVGERCVRCGHLGVGMVSCTLCGGVTTPVDDVMGGAVGAALVQQATIEYCDADEIEDIGGVAAILRY